MIGLVVSRLFLPFLFNLTNSCMRTFSLNSQGRTEQWTANTQERAT